MAGDTPTYPGWVRVQSEEASGEGLRWDPALTEQGPANDRSLSWDAVANLQTLSSAWYQHTGVLGWLLPPVPLDDAVLELDRVAVETFFRERGWPDAQVELVRSPATRPTLEDIFFVVDLDPRGEKGPISPDVSAVEPGWKVFPVVSALDRGSFLSAYAGVQGDWLGSGAQPRQVDVHAELGIRAFGDATSHVPFGGNVGPWSDFHLRFDEGVAPATSVFLEIGAASNLWPTLIEGRGQTGVGLQWGRFRKFNGNIALRGGRWNSWAWDGQQAKYNPWFTDVDGPRLFLPGYSYGRLDLTLVADTTDRSVFPRHGMRLEVSGTPLGLAADNLFFVGEVDARVFIPLGSPRWVWGLRGRGGALVYTAQEDVDLLGERFHLGGPDMRAWGIRRVRPPGYSAGPYDLRNGGDLVTYFNTDIAWHVHRDLTLVAFSDVGRVWESSSEIALNQMLMDVGSSVAVAALKGTLRLDLAYRPTLQPVDGDSRIGVQLWFNLPF